MIDQPSFRLPNLCKGSLVHQKLFCIHDRSDEARMKGLIKVWRRDKRLKVEGPTGKTFGLHMPIVVTAYAPKTDGQRCVVHF
jgi:hypothetical protein